MPTLLTGKVLSTSTSVSATPRRAPSSPTCSAVCAAASLGLPFAVVPCCVFARRSPHRRTAAGKPVRSWEDFCEYLAENPRLSFFVTPDVHFTDQYGNDLKIERWIAKRKTADGAFQHTYIEFDARMRDFVHAQSARWFQTEEELEDETHKAKIKEVMEEVTRKERTMKKRNMRTMETTEEQRRKAGGGQKRRVGGDGASRERLYKARRAGVPVGG